MLRPTSIGRSSSSASSAPTAADRDVTDTAIAGTVRPRPLSVWLAAGCVAVVAVCAARAVLDRYVPLDDNAVTETRARDVFSARVPLIGTVSSVTQIGPGVVNHPGPLLFDLLAVPVRLFPHGSGIAVGVAMIHIATLVTMAWCSRRLLGDVGACVVMAVAAGFLWSLGSEAWFEVWQPVVPMLPFLLALVALWALAAGVDAAAIPAVVATSFAVQTHGSYLLLGPSLVLIAIVWRFAAPGRAVTSRRPLVAAGVVGGLVWLQPLIDQVFGTGNMSALFDRATNGQEGRALGFVDAVRAAAEVFVKPPLWLRPGVDSSLPNSGGMQPSADGPVFDPDWIPFSVAGTGLLVLLALLGLAGFVGWRRQDRVVAGGAVVAVAAVVMAVVSLAGLPVDSFGFTAHKCRWLWPIGAYITAFAFVTLIRLGITASARQASLAAATVGAVALAATIPTSNQLVSAQQYMVASQGPARALRDAVSTLAGRGVVFLDLSGRPFPDPYNDTVAAEMVAGGIEFRVEGDYVVAQYGTGRRLDPGDRVDVTVRTFIGSQAPNVPADWEVLADISSATQWVILAAHPGLVREFAAPTD